MRTAIVSTYPPRACGIGTFAADVRSALLGLDGIDRVEKVVIVNEPSRPQRPGLTATIAQAVRGDYMRAARILGRLDVDVVLLQHEYGIFGGRDGDYVVVARRGAVAAARGDAAHGAVAADRASGEGAGGGLPSGRARDRDDRDGAAPPRRRRHLRRATRFGSCPTARRRCWRSAPRPTRWTRAAGNGVAAAQPGTATAGKRFLLSTFGLISAGQGPRDGDRGAAGDRGAPSRGALRDRRADASRTSRTARASGTGCRSRRRCSTWASRITSSSTTASSASTRSPTCSPTTDVFVTPYREREQISSGALTFGIAAGCGVVVDPVLVRAGHARHGRRHDRAVRRSRRARRRRLPLHRAAGAARRSPRRGAADRGRSWPGRRSPRRRRPCCARPSSSRRAAAGRSSGIDQRLVEPANRPSADARRRRRHRAARERRDPEPRERVLRRRRRATRGRRARARPPRRRAGLDVDRLPLDRVPPGRDRRRRPACGTSWATTAAGSTSPTSATTSAAPSGRSARSSRRRGSPPSSARPSGSSTSIVHLRPGGRIAPHGRLRRPRPRPPRPGPAQPGGPSSCWSA